MISRRMGALGAVAALVWAGLGMSGAPAQAASDPCAAPVKNPVACENSLPGSPQSSWYLANMSGYGDIDGFTTQYSVQAGDRLDFKVKTTATSYTVTVFRLGWYNGDGARQIASFAPSATLPQTQPDCVSDATTGLVDCGNWNVSASWTVPSTAVSGLYIANLNRTDGTPGVAQIPFVVRQDSSTSDILYQTSDETWQAYNKYGGYNLYEGTFPGSSDGRAFKVSYNRPLQGAPTNTFYNAELPMIRWLERNGYDVSYSGATDTAFRGANILKHKVFMSSGHDEYWSGEQRSNVEAARAAGVNLAFFSGNEVFWKTRWEPSIDGTSTSNRTLVCYKETKGEQKIDPTSTWTGTWRDATFSPPSDGGRPENGLTGTLFRVNGYRADAIQVPAQFAPLRFWRNTSVASLTGSQVATLSAGTLGYEWDEDALNSVRPQGAIDLSSTTITVDNGQLLLDNGWIYGSGPATHSMVMYRDPTSHALVFGSGTVQWSWGLDPLHSYAGPPTDPNIQQATVNVLADMGAQPLTLMSGLVAATASTDTTGPTVTVTSPAAGSTVPANSAVTVSGTAADAGGVVARVEVSTDGGTTWNPATGTSSWSYTWTPKALGSATLLVRASDDSANLGGSASQAVTVGPQNCPCTVFGSTATPTLVQSGDSSSVELGMRFRPSVNGYVTGVRFYKGSGNTGTHTGSLWTSTGTLLETGTFANETASGWQSLTFGSPVAVKANTDYVISYHAPSGHYAADSGYFTTAAGLAPLVAPKDGDGGSNGLYRYGSGTVFPNSTSGSANYWVDVNFATTATDTTPPSVTSTTPAANATGVSNTGSLTAVFNELLDPTSVSFTLTAADGTKVAGATSYSSATNTATFAPASQLALSTTYTATVSASDTSGNAMTPLTWTFTTAQSAPAPSCPCSIFPTASPAQTSVADTTGVELGVRFSSDSDGLITGVKFYKGSRNTGTHTGSLWTSSGTLLATGTFTNESASGWQTLTFGTPVAITKNTTYIASYYAPVGGYAADSGYFTNYSIYNAPLTAPISSASARNGVYNVGAGFPTSSYNDTNYWVDVVFDTKTTDTTPPTVTSTTPASGATGVALNSAVTATFSKAVSSSSLQFTLTTGAGTAVAGTTSYDATTQTATFTPTGGLSASTTYTASVKASDTAGNAMPTATTWSFTSGAGAYNCPCNLFTSAQKPATAASSDGNSVEVGVRFSPQVSGKITGIRFYKGSTNLGTHVAHLWTNTGTLLASATFTNETATGWQTVTFATPVDVTAGTTYVASYLAPRGHYAATGAFFTSPLVNTPLTAPATSSTSLNGVYAYGTGAFPTNSYNAANYWVDVVFQ